MTINITDCNRSVSNILFVHRIITLAIAILTLSAGWGCKFMNHESYYSGKFVVTSKNEKLIIIKEWRNFDWAQPGDGYIAPETEASTSFQKLSQIPESTVVTWVFEGAPSEEVHSQTIDLKGVIPKNTEGYTNFTFGEDGIWTVKFVPTAK